MSRGRRERPDLTAGGAVGGIVQIAGAVLAAHRHGFAVAAVERASTPRSGPYPLDVRGTERAR